MFPSASFEKPSSKELSSCLVLALPKIRLLRNSLLRTNVAISTTHSRDVPEVESTSITRDFLAGDGMNPFSSFTASTSELSPSLTGDGDLGGTGFDLIFRRADVLGAAFAGDEVTYRSRVACFARYRGMESIRLVGTVVEFTKHGGARPNKSRMSSTGSGGLDASDDDAPPSRGPSFQVDRPRPSAQFPQSIPSHKSNNEHQKFLSLVIRNLRERVKPPTLFEQLSSDGRKRQLVGVEAVVESFRAAVRVNTSTQQRTQTVANPLDDEETAPTGYSTEDTKEMMEKLLDILVLARRQGRDIFPPR